MNDWTVEDEPSDDDVKVLADGVLSYGRKEAVGGKPRPLACFLREHGRVIAGASGRLEFDRLFVVYLWVAEDHRGTGLGTTALACIEQAATERGARDALIETLNDRTAAMYRRLGYAAVARVDRYVGHFTKHVMVKLLTAEREG